MDFEDSRKEEQIMITEDENLYVRSHPLKNSNKFLEVMDVNMEMEVDAHTAKSSENQNQAFAFAGQTEE